MVAIFAARSRGVRDVVLTGNLTQLAFCRQKAEYFNGLEEAYGVHFLIPDLAQFSTVIGTALQG